MKKKGKEGRNRCYVCLIGEEKGRVGFKKLLLVRRVRE